MSRSNLIANVVSLKIGKSITNQSEGEINVRLQPEYFPAYLSLNQAVLFLVIIHRRDLHDFAH